MLDILYFLTGGFLSARQKVKDSKKTNENRNKALANGSHVYRDADGRLKYDNMFVGHKNVDGHDCLVSEEPDGTYGKVIIDYYNGSLQEEIDKIISKQKREKLLNKIEAYASKTKNKPFGYSYNKNGYEYFDISTGKKYKIVTFRSRVYNGYKYVKGKLYEDGNIIIFMDYEYRNWMVNDTGKFDEEEYWNNRFYDEINQKHDKGEICDLTNRNYRYDEESLNRYLSKVKLHENEYCKYNFNDPLYYYTEVETGRKYYLIVGGGLIDYVIRNGNGIYRAIENMHMNERNKLYGGNIVNTLSWFLKHCIMKIYEGKNEIHLYYVKTKSNEYYKKDIPYAKSIVSKKWGDIILDMDHDEPSKRKNVIKCDKINDIKFKIENIEDAKEDYPDLLKFFNITID